ncbi:MAG: hypothetical protein ACRDUB_22980, partial [Mycobacterium sp.]
MNDDHEHDDDEVVGEPVAAAVDHSVTPDAAVLDEFIHGVGRTPGTHAAMNAMVAGSGLSGA